MERGVFTTLIEIFPPNFSVETAKEPLIGIKQKMQRHGGPGQARSRTSRTPSSSPT